MPDQEMKSHIGDHIDMRDQGMKDHEADHRDMKDQEISHGIARSTVLSTQYKNHVQIVIRIYFIRAQSVGR